jgi:hypothetical protein
METPLSVRGFHDTERVSRGLRIVAFRCKKQRQPSTRQRCESRCHRGAGIRRGDDSILHTGWVRSRWNHSLCGAGLRGAIGVSLGAGKAAARGKCIFSIAVAQAETWCTHADERLAELEGWAPACAGATSEGGG